MDSRRVWSALRSPISALVVLGGLSVMAYAGSLSGGWVYEDIRDLGIWETPLSWRIGPRWLTAQSYALTTWAVWPSAVAFRSVSLAWHLLNGWLAWLVFRSVGSSRVAVLGAGLFLLWPVQTEAVAAVAYRSELVAASFLLIALWCAQRGWIMASWLCAAGAVLGKEAGVIALALVPLWAWQVGLRWTRWQAAGWALASILPALAVAQWFTVHFVPLFQSVSGMAVSAAIVGRLVGLGLWSVLQPDVLSIDHDWRGLTATMGIATMAGGVVLGWMWTGWARFAVIWISVALSLRIVLVLPEIHEHHLYLAWVVVSLALAHVILGGQLWQDRSSNFRNHFTRPTARLASS